MIQKINIADIARITGYSTSTVSRVLNGKADNYRISKATQEKIKSTADEYNYTPNEFARNLRKGSGRTIALIVPSLKNPFFAEMASAINLEASKANYITLIGDSDDNIAIERRTVKQLTSRSIDGMIIVPCSNVSDHLLQLKKRGMPLICIDRYFENQDLSFVTSDNYNGAYLAAKYLIELGHTNIACIQGVKDSTPNTQRVKGFKDAMSDHGINTYSVTGDSFSEQNGYLETKLLLQTENRPTAIFAFSNTIAMGSLKAIREEELKIPDEISLITFDNNPYLDYIDPPLTCVSQPIEEICKMAIRILFTKINEKENTTKRVFLKTRLMIKESAKSIIQK